MLWCNDTTCDLGRRSCNLATVSNRRKTAVTIAEIDEFLDTKAPYLSLASHGTNVAAGTELSHSQAAALIWFTSSKP